MDVALKDSWPLDLHSVLSPDLARDFSADNDRARLNLGLHPSALTDDERVGGVDLPAERSADPDRAEKAQLPLEFAAGLYA